MPNPTARQLIIITLVVFAALALTFTLILRNSFDFRGISFEKMPGWRLAYDVEKGTPLPNDPALILPRPIELARIPTASRLDMPMGSEHGALTYDFQPFLTLNPERGGKHLGDDLNGIGGMDTDLGDPVNAIGAGRVIFSGEAGGGWGNVIIIAHRLSDGRHVQSFYAHCQRRDVAAGFDVVRGEQIGTVGKGGGAYPAHLHFEVRDSLCPNPGRGYFTSALNRLDPTGTVKKFRNAPDELLTPAPQVLLPDVEIVR